jgi:hypothetical protein
MNRQKFAKLRIFREHSIPKMNRKMTCRRCRHGCAYSVRRFKTLIVKQQRKIAAHHFDDDRQFL